MSRKGTGLRGALALALLCPIAARAAEEPPPPPEVTMDEVVVRLPRAEATDDPTASASVVEPGRFAGEAKAVAELVATAPGVAVNGYGGLGGLATASIRGSTADGVLVLLDGLPLNAAFGGGVDLSTVPRHWLDRIEVVRGAEGAHYGAGALGGVLNVVTRAPEAGRWSAEASGGSFETFSLSTDRAFRAGPVSVLAAASADATGGRFAWDHDATPSDPGGEETLHRDNNAAGRLAGLLKTAAQLGRTRLDGLLHLSGGRREIPLPARLGALPGSDRQEDARAVLALRASAPGPWPGLRLSGGVRARLDRLDVRVRDVDSEQRGGAAGLAAEAALAHGPALLTVSLDGSGERLEATGTGDRSRATLAATIAEDVVLGDGRFRFAPALRVERIGAFEGWSAKAGASVRVAHGLGLRASAGRTFRAPSFAELYLRQGVVQPNPELAPETGWAVDGGAVLDGSTGFAAVTGFATRYDDLILYDAVSLDEVRARNLGRATASGLEIEAASAPIPSLAGLSVSGAYTLLATRNLRAEADALGNWLPRRARHRAFARAAVRPGRFGAHVEVHHVGRQYRDAKNDWPIDAATVWNGGASVRLGWPAPLALAFELRNVLGDRTLQDAFGNPLPGRMVMVTLRAGSTLEGAP